MIRPKRSIPAGDEKPAAVGGPVETASVEKADAIDEPSPPANDVKSDATIGESFQQRVTRLENLRQTEGLLEAALRYAMVLGWADGDNGGGRIIRGDGTEVKPSDRATEMAVDRLHPILEAVAAEIVAIEGASTEKRVTYQAIVEGTNPKQPSRSPHPAESLEQFISAMVRDAVSAEFERRAHLARKARKNAASQ